jgi:hypothetical protein
MGSFPQTIAVLKTRVVKPPKASYNGEGGAVPMKYSVHKSATSSDAVVLSDEENDDFVASFRNGKWQKQLLFNAYELEDLLLVTDEAEATRIFQQAMKALGNQQIVA